MGKTILPTHSGKIYSIWNLQMLFLFFPLNNTLQPHYLEPGFRLNSISCCWSVIESFLRACLYDLVMSKYNDLTLPKEWMYKPNIVRKIKIIFISKQKIENYEFQEKMKLKMMLATKVNQVSWEALKNIAKSIGYGIDNINNDKTAFIKHLYSLRNGFMHGLEIKILKSSSTVYKDEITIKYLKALNYLDQNKIIDKKLLIDKQDIADFLNKKTTDFIINETAKVGDEIANIFNLTYTAKQWVSARNPPT